MKYIANIACLLLTSFCAFAQNDVRVQLQLGNFGSPQNSYSSFFTKGIINNYGASVLKKIDQSLGARISYSRWGKLNSKSFPYSDEIRHDVSVSTSNIGKTVGRSNYSFVEIAAYYSKHIKKHEFGLFVGPSFCWGKNRQLTSVYVFAPGYDQIVDYKSVNASYIGGVWGGEYNYLFLNNRINTGIAIVGRYYLQQFSTYTLQFSVGYNFNYNKTMKSVVSKDN